MSKGMGELQRWLLAELEGREKGAIPVRDLTARRLPSLDIGPWRRADGGSPRAVPSGGRSAAWPRLAVSCGPSGVAMVVPIETRPTRPMQLGSR
jgi:hypothetical protein